MVWLQGIGQVRLYQYGEVKGWEGEWRNGETARNRPGWRIENLNRTHRTRLDDSVSAALSFENTIYQYFNDLKIK
ncbi:hypothetical protein [Achromobacter aloeverae]